MDPIAKAHIKNLRSIRKATTQVNLALNEAIKREDELQESIYTRLLIFLWVMWAECKLNVLLTASPQVDDQDRDEILANCRNQIEKWNCVLDKFIRRRYLEDDTKREISRLSLGHTAYHRYATLNSLINDQLALYVGIRNRLAHGQWHIALTSDLATKNPELTQSIWKLDKSDTLVLKWTLIVLSEAMKNLIQSRDGFEKLFDKHLRKLDLVRRDFKGRMNELRTAMIASYRSIPDLLELSLPTSEDE
jgi:hypothetical protein